jgi:hypothetical protein
VVLEANRDIKELAKFSESMGIPRMIEVGIDPMTIILHDLADRTRSKVAKGDLPGLLGKDRR